MVQPEEVELLVSPPTQAPGNRMQGSALSFQTPEMKMQLAQLSEQAFFQHLVTARSYYRIRLDEDDGWAKLDHVNVKQGQHITGGARFTHATWRGVANPAVARHTPSSDCGVRRHRMMLLSRSTRVDVAAPQTAIRPNATFVR